MHYVASRLVCLAFIVVSSFNCLNAAPYSVTETDDEIRVETTELAASIRKRGYICLIEEFGGRPVKAGESFSAAFIVGYFDNIEEMQVVYDAHKGHTGLKVDANAWMLTK